MDTKAAKSYPIKGGEFGRNRLSSSRGGSSPQTGQLFERAGIRTEFTAVDVGCGGGQVSLHLAAARRA
jgi:hypothetical protein